MMRSGGGYSRASPRAATSPTGPIPAGRVSCRSSSDPESALPRALLTLSRLTEANGLRHLGSSLGIVRRDHWVVEGQRPFLPILRRGEAPRGEVALQRLVWPPVLHADEVAGRDRLLDRDRWLKHH